MKSSTLIALGAFFIPLSFQVRAFAATDITMKIDAERALRLPISKRIEAVEKQGPVGRAALERMAFDQGESLENRWRAVTAVGRAYGPESQAFLERALKSPEWYMRNAATIVIQYGSHPWAEKWARAMLEDSALVVRTAAVESLKALNAVGSKDLLWEKLYNAQNYRAGESLWIRRHILQALVQFATPQQEAKFTALLNDQDKSLRPLARQALQKIRDQKFQGSSTAAAANNILNR